jgi:SSS family solute:Na+ symporter
LVAASLYWKRLTKAGGYACVLVAMASWLWFFHDSGYAADPKYGFLGMLPVATMTACSTAAMILVSLLTRPPSNATLKKFFPES